MFPVLPFFVFHSRSPFPVPRSHFSVPCSPFPVVRSPFPVLSFGNIPLKSTYFCHIWLGIASRASFLAANTKRFVVTSRHFTSSFPGSLFPRVPLLPVLFIPGKRLLSRTFRKVFVFYISFVSDDCHQVPRDLKENELSLCS